MDNIHDDVELILEGLNHQPDQRPLVLQQGAHLVQPYGLGVG